MERKPMSHNDFDAWNYREGTDVSGRQEDLAGFKVHATDGHIGKIDAATREVDDRYVDVDRKKDEIKDSPELRDEDLMDDTDHRFNDEYRGRLSDYYGERPGGPGD